MGQKIETDLQRFRKIVRGKVKSNLSKYLSRGEMIGKKGNDLVSIPLPSINLPQFRYGKKNSGGVGVGPGQPGQPLTQPQGDGDDPQAGDQPGGHILEVDLTMEELAEILGEELALPRIEPRGQKNIVTEKDKYTSIRGVGPESLEVKLVEERDIPWDDFAFSSGIFALRHYLEDRAAGRDGVHISDSDSFTR